MTKTELDQLADQGRLAPDCRLRRQGWSGTIPVARYYPRLGSADGAIVSRAPRRSRSAPKRSTLTQNTTPRTFWYVQSADGAETGPFSRQVLDDMAHDGRLDDRSRIRQQDWNATVPATDLYPGLPYVVLATLAFDAPPPTPPRGIQANPMLQPVSDKPQNAGIPRIGAPKSTADSAFVVAAILFGFFVGVGWLVLRRPWQTISLIETFVYLGCYAGGVFCLDAAIFNWPFFWSFRKARFMRGILGEGAARCGYAAIGVVLAGFALVQMW